MPRRGLRTKDYPPEARERLGKAVEDARLALGYQSREAFGLAVGRSERSVDAVERGEGTVGAGVLGSIASTLARQLREWNADTPRSILEGGPIPELHPVDPAQPVKAQLDVVWNRALEDFIGIFRSGADADSLQRKTDYWRPRFHSVGRTDTDLLDVIKKARKDAQGDRKRLTPSDG